MTWTNLNEIMSDKGCIPYDALCRVIVGNGTRLKKKNRKKKLKTDLKILVKKVKKKLVKIDGQKMTVAKFLKKCEEFGKSMEWTFTPSGRLVQYRGPFNKNSTMVWKAVVQLDLKNWLKSQEEAVITKIATAAFLWRQDGTDLALKFYEMLGRAAPDEIRLSNIKVAS